MGQESRPGVASWQARHGNDEVSPFLQGMCEQDTTTTESGTATKQMACALRVWFEEQRTIKLDGEVGRRRLGRKSHSGGGTNQIN